MQTSRTESGAPTANSFSVVRTAWHRMPHWRSTMSIRTSSCSYTTCATEQQYGGRLAGQQATRPKPTIIQTMMDCAVYSRPLVELCTTVSCIVTGTK